MRELTFAFGDRAWTLAGDGRVMGILNVTPDSFSDGGLYAGVDAAIEHGLRMAREGADIIDVGGESTRPGAGAVDAEAESERVVPVVRELSRQLDVPISIDTAKAPVARAAFAAGAAIVNDVSGLRRDPAMIDVVRQTGAGCVAMHMRGTPETMQTETTYGDLIGDILDYFTETLELTRGAGIPDTRVMLDPGIGFAKSAEQNLELIMNVDRFRSLGRPVLMGPSRKSFIGKILGREAPTERAWGTAAAVACCIMRGADVVRVHDVKEMVDAARVAAAIRSAAQ